MINLIFRKKGQGTSIEELFKDIILFIKKEYGANIQSDEVPFSRISLLNILKNILHLQKKKGIIHITGDIHYVAIMPFKNIVLTIHDVGSALKGGFIMVFFKKLIWFWLPSFFVKRITVISHFSKGEVLKIMPWTKNKIKVIHNPVNSSLKYCPKTFNSDVPEILHIGTKENKNLENTIKGLKNIPCKLIIVGRLTNYQSILLKENLICFENYFDVPYIKIKELYEACDIVSFISRYEGFGMPIIEAQKVGRVLITSKMASIPEIAGNGAHFSDPYKVKSIKEGFIKLIKEEDYRNFLIEEGRRNVKRFELEKIAEQYFKLYNTL